MADDELDFDRVDHEIRINELQERVRELTGGRMEAFESEDFNDPKLREIREAFWENVVKVEEGEWVTARQQLQAAGVELPSPEELADEQLAAKLQEVIVRLAELRTYLHNTDHLSDRELYAALWREVLDDSVPAAMVGDSAGAHIIDLVGSGSEEHMGLYLRYYADDRSRRQWQKEFPDYAMPPHEEPPYDRDRQLPRPPLEQGPPRREGRPEDRPADIDELAARLTNQREGVYTFYDCDTGRIVAVAEEYLNRARDGEPDEEPWREPVESEREIMDLARAIIADPSVRFADMPGVHQINEWEMMRAFAEELADRSLGGRLAEALEDDGAEERFANLVGEAGLDGQWSAFRDRCYRQIAREWCQWQNIPVKSEAPEESPGAA